MNFLGRGWAFPPQFNRDGRVRMVEGVEDIHQSLHIILSTSLGERVLRPDFGCNMKVYQFEPMNSGFIGFVRDLVENALLYHEPRIKVERVEIEDDNQVEGKLLIEVVYTVRTTNSRYNFVYDYYTRGEAATV